MARPSIRDDAASSFKLPDEAEDLGLLADPKVPFPEAHAPSTPVHELQRMLADRLVERELHSPRHSPALVPDVVERSVQFISCLAGPVLLGLSAWGVLALIF